MKYTFQLLTLILHSVIVHYNVNAQGAADTVSFEAPEPEIVLDTVGGNIWQIGEPHKTFFDSAHSGTRAILTDTLNTYPPNDTSSFIYIIRNPFTQTCLTCMEFWHKYDMDTLADKGLIDASYDGGNSWVVVKDTFVNTIGSHFMWDPDYHALNGNFTNHPLITTGKSDGWIKSGFCWQWYLPVTPDTIIPNPDSMLIRFTFISDSIVENKEGWMIDDIVAAAKDELCSSTEEHSRNEAVTVYPNPFSTEAIIQSENDFKNATLTVYNSLGQQVMQLKNVYGESILLGRDQLPAGLYFLHLAQDNKIFTTVKLIITDH